MTYRSLIERLEKAKGSDGELDARIWFVVDRAAASRCFWNAALGLPKPIPDDLPDGLGRNAVIANAPRFTASIDAALELVPKGHAWYVRRNCSADGDEIYCNAQVWPFCNPRDDDVPRYWANAPDGAPAVALCLAALKSRVDGERELRETKL